jgi:hypothetical protein
MKYVITFLLLIAVVINGLTGYRFFRTEAYDLSSLLIVASYLSIVFSIYVLTMGKKKAAFQ